MIVKSQQNRIESVTRPTVSFRFLKLDNRDVTSGSPKVAGSASKQLLGNLSSMTAGDEKKIEHSLQIQSPPRQPPPPPPATPLGSSKPPPPPAYNTSFASNTSTPLGLGKPGAKQVLDFSLSQSPGDKSNVTSALGSSVAAAKPPAASFSFGAGKSGEASTRSGH